ncbi:ac19-like protein [Lambdina fiscellaria nucleopolyhedrovirus]|uniref:Ac19-like protein n=1 Tax=Lambdina fiscellaria nucleopolyhedrovirus TaxID=1642929 RepID=A0A0E3UR94_9ABAC|nr:ac19-like protein [Lambdina fiscellaria nucleopolyhedrovirus]AKC91640.1 ac19-like protein [Lambdina fiscellaria nucleopolyhedrovirus]
MRVHKRNAINRTRLQSVNRTVYNVVNNKLTEWGNRAALPSENKNESLHSIVLQTLFNVRGDREQRLQFLFNTVCCNLTKRIAAHCQNATTLCAVRNVFDTIVETERALFAQSRILTFIINFLIQRLAFDTDGDANVNHADAEHNDNNVHVLNGVHGAPLQTLVFQRLLDHFLSTYF